MRSFAIEIIKHRDNIAGALRLTIKTGIIWLVAQSMPQRVHAYDTIPVRQRIDDFTLLPAFGAHQ